MKARIENHEFIGDIIFIVLVLMLFGISGYIKWGIGGVLVFITGFIILALLIIMLNYFVINSIEKLKFRKKQRK